MKMEPINPEAPQPHKAERSMPINPIIIIIYGLLMGSVFAAAFVMGLGTNAIVLTGYAFMSMGFVSIGLLFVIAMKTNGITELKSFLYGKPIMAVHRKDGQVDFVLGNYGQGTVNSRKYGRFFVNPEAVARIKKSGSGLIHVIDAVGTAMTDDFVKAVNVLKNKFGLHDIYEVEAAKNYWSVCQRCKAEGVPLLKTVMTVDNKPENVEVCGNCKAENLMKRVDFPTLPVPLFESLNYNVFPGFFDENQNPDRVNVIIKREVQAELEDRNKFSMKLFSILLGVGIMFLLIAIALLVLLPKLAEWSAPAAGSIAPAITG